MLLLEACWAQVLAVTAASAQPVPAHPKPPGSMSRGCPSGCMSPRTDTQRSQRKARGSTPLATLACLRKSMPGGWVLGWAPRVHNLRACSLELGAFLGIDY